MVFLDMVQLYRKVKKIINRLNKMDREEAHTYLQEQVSIFKKYGATLAYFKEEGYWYIISDEEDLLTESYIRIQYRHPNLWSAMIVDPEEEKE
jgi:hypothetical protein